MIHCRMCAAAQVRGGARTHRLANGDEDAEELLRAGEEGAVLLEALVDVDDLRTREQLHHQSGGDNGRDAQLHERATVRREQHAHPVERIGALVSFAAIDGDLAADQENEERD